MWGRSLGGGESDIKFGMRPNVMHQPFILTVKWVRPRGAVARAHAWCSLGMVRGETRSVGKAADDDFLARWKRPTMGKNARIDERTRRPEGRAWGGFLSVADVKSARYPRAGKARACSPPSADERHPCVYEEKRTFTTRANRRRVGRPATDNKPPPQRPPRWLMLLLLHRRLYVARIDLPTRAERGSHRGRKQKRTRRSPRKRETPPPTPINRVKRLTRLKYRWCCRSIRTPRKTNGIFFNVFSYRSITRIIGWCAF